MSAPNTFYITTPIYYVNDVPHIGHAYTTVAADVLARYWRLRGRDVFFLTGLDEHGQKVQQAAAKAGIDPQRYCDGMVPRFQELWKRLEISNDAFIRTTDAKHKIVVQRYLQELFNKQLIYQGSYMGWYCTFDERFWTEKDVADGLCPDCKRPVEKLSEHNYFFKMGQYQDRLIDHIKEHEAFIRPESRRNEVLGFLQTQKLGDLSISRPKARLSWGIELPFDKNYVTYVWFDALVNYVSALEYLPQGKPAGNSFWPANVHLIGKDILTTHAVYWSTMLMALDLPLPQTIFAHGWWTVDGEKMSKSRGNVVDPYAMADKYKVYGFRYFLLREVPFGQDGDFSETALVRRVDSDIANGLGNLLRRTLTLIERYAGGAVPEVPPSLDTDVEENLTVAGLEAFSLADSDIEEMAFSRALEQIWQLVRAADQYLETHAPWTLAKDPGKRKLLERVLYRAADSLRLLAIAVYPFIPSTARAIREQLGLNPDFFSNPIPFEERQWHRLRPGTKIHIGDALSPRMGAYALTGHEAKLSVSQGASTVSDTPTPPQPVTATAVPTTAAPQAPLPAATAPLAPSPAQITIDEFMQIQLKTARVLSAERVPKSEKLLKLQVSLGSEQRQIVAGIGKKYEPEALVGKTIVIVANLKPAKLMGIESQGMVLAAGDSEVRGLITILEEVDPGTTVK
ncbi:MAG: methionine--tRNA ligase [Nitrospirae bacterium]|nr:methionine--tRNA ligase [Nitrospirota bacterium]